MRRGAIAAIVAAAGLLATACQDLTVPNYNSPTPGTIANDPSAIQFATTGILVQDRSDYELFISDAGIFGRESFDYFPTDARSHVHYVAQNPLDPAGFASGGWNGRYRNLRNIHNFISAVDASAVLSDQQKAAARGFAKTFAALTYYYLVTTRHDLGIPVEIKDDPKETAPFVSRDSAWNYLAALNEEAGAELEAAGGVAFPFSLPAGFSLDGDFTSPAAFLKVNRGLQARYDAVRASLGNPACGPNGATCYQNAIIALNESYLSLSASELYAGPYHIYSLESGDAVNNLNADAYPDYLAHPSILTDAPADDERIVAKIRTLDSPRGPSGGAANGIQTTIGFQMYPAITSPTPIVRNEELILLRAEARWFTGDKLGAISDLTWIANNSGGKALSTTLTVASTDDEFITELLYQRRLSLLWEGFRWADVRRFGKLNTLPLDLPSHFLQMQQPIPKAECDFRAGLSAELHCPAQS